MNIEKLIKESEFSICNEILSDANFIDVMVGEDSEFLFKINEKIQLKIIIQKDGKILDIIPPEDDSITPDEVYEAIQKRRKQSSILISTFENKIFEQIVNFLNL